MAEEDYVQLAGDGSGKQVKNFLLRGVVQGDGTSVDVYVQCVSIVGADGLAVDFEEMTGVLRDLLREVRWIRKGFGEMTENGELTLGLSDGSDDGGDGGDGA